MFVTPRTAYFSFQKCFTQNLSIIVQLFFLGTILRDSDLSIEIKYILNKNVLEFYSKFSAPVEQAVCKKMTIVREGNMMLHNKERIHSCIKKKNKSSFTCKQ